MGKTTVCQAVADLARRLGYRPNGVITPALYACPERSRRACPADWELGIWDLGFAKVGFEAMDVGSGERWPLARTDQDLGGPRVGPYSFDPAALARALRVLRRACPEQSRRVATAGCDLLIVDEIGPLELEQGKGFAPILDLAWWQRSRTVRPGSPKPCSAPAERETSFATPEEGSEDSLPGERPMHTLIVVRPALLDKLLLRLRETVRLGSPEPSFATPFKVFSVTEENRDELPLRIVEEFWGNG